MTAIEIADKYRDKPYFIKMGAGKLAKRNHVDRQTIYEAKRILLDEKQKTYRDLPKILLLDTETAPVEAYVFSLWKQNIAWDHTNGHWFMLCWSAKWLYDAEIMGDRLTGEEALKEDDSRIMRSLWALFDEADIVIAHNALGADIPWVNTRFLMNGLKPPRPYRIIDTLQVARKKFGFMSNKLDALCEYFGFPHKLDTDFELWRKCVHGDEESLAYMQEYNKNDVKMLELVYLKLLPWIPNHPPLGNLVDSTAMICPHCGSVHMQKIDGFYTTQVSRYELFRCEDCGAVARGRDNLNKKNDVKLVSLNI